jgi:uncharacterized protein (TIGR02246 family)
VPDVIREQWEIRDLIERYAQAVDRGDGKAAAALFAADGELEMWLDPAQDGSTAIRRGRAEIAAAIDGLRAFHVTQHAIASSVIDIDGNSAAGETRCVAHHVRTGEGQPRDEVLYITYVERVARADGHWRFTRRELRVEWTSIQQVESM